MCHHTETILLSAALSKLVNNIWFGLAFLLIEEIYKMFCTFSPILAETVSDVLLEAKQTIPYGRLVMCGPGRSGKSSLLRSFLKQKFRKESDSTIGVELEKAMCTIRKEGKTYTWTQATTTYDQHVSLTRKAISNVIRRREIESDLLKKGHAIPAAESSNLSTAAMQQPESSGSRPANVALAEQSTEVAEKAPPVETKSTPTSPGLDDISFQSLVKDDGVAGLEAESSAAKVQLERFLDDLRKGNVNVSDKEFLRRLVFLDIWDFAGQRLFAAIQHMVLACSRCAYIVVFDTSQKLNAPASETFGKSGVEHKLGNAMGLTNFEVMETWLNTIHEVLGSRSDVPVFVVGTHIDKLPKKERAKMLKEIEAKVWENAAGKSYGSIIEKIVFVDNTKAGTDEEDAMVVSLRQEIIEHLQQQFKDPIPLRWLPVTVALHHVAEQFQRPWLTIAELWKIACAARGISEESSKDDFYEMLQFHHNLGHVLHFATNSRLSDRVIIDVHWLVKVVSLLFCPEPPDKQGRKVRLQFETLSSKGILLESLAVYRWQQHSKQTAMYTHTEEHRKYIFDIAEHFALLYNTGEKAPSPGSSREEDVSQKFFVPALVTREVRIQEEMSKGKPTPSMYLYSGKDQYFPQTLFWCGVVRCMQKFSPSSDPILYHTSARLLCQDCYWLVLRYFQHGMQMFFESPLSSDSHIASGSECAEVEDDCSILVSLCWDALSYLEEQLHELKQLSLKHVNIGRAVRCPCSFNKDKCRKHKKASCPDIECHHFAPLIVGKRTRCPLGGRPEVDISEVRKYWLCPPTKLVSASWISACCRVTCMFIWLVCFWCLSNEDCHMLGVSICFIQRHAFGGKYYNLLETVKRV